MRAERQQNGSRRCTKTLYLSDKRQRTSSHILAIAVQLFGACSWAGELRVYAHVTTEQLRAEHVRNVVSNTRKS
ncbi:hypothetical protein XELAEV_18027828mg [Xenopus laevis]|uniref:Uncharacterized protein n=1 Tax=Xenopus laevis TaxID=8355 RepID=A0A974CYH0_XENLA|nr:hypothetical protein XELAEV_18027828mg [Xenopus laevis]